MFGCLFIRFNPISYLCSSAKNCHSISKTDWDGNNGPARLIAQIVSGIGFLGAGTIVITRHFVTGLTTAASLWVTAGLGIAIGMGYYQIALTSSV